MHPRLMLLAALPLAACGGHSAAPETGPAPAARAATPAGDPATIRYAPGTARYRYEQVQHARREMMGQVQETDASTTLLLTVTVAPGENGNLNADYRIDSVAVVGNSPGTGPLQGLQGRSYRTVITASGRPVSFTPPDTSALSALGGEMFKEFMPTLPPATAAGTTWTDTVAPPPTTAQGATIRTRSIRNHRVVGWEMHDGARALHVVTAGTYTIDGEGQEGGASFTLSGVGAAASDRFISAAGGYLGAGGNDSANIQVLVPAAGIEIPIRQVRRTTLTRLP